MDTLVPAESGCPLISSPVTFLGDWYPLTDTTWCFFKPEQRPHRRQSSRQLRLDQFLPLSPQPVRRQTPAGCQKPLSAVERSKGLSREGLAARDTRE
ncbi:unnamed protein product [Lota lota]